MVGDGGKKWKKRKHKNSRKTGAPANTLSTAVNNAIEPPENIPEDRQSVPAVTVTQQKELLIFVSAPQPFRNASRGRGRGRSFGKGGGA